MKILKLIFMTILLFTFLGIVYAKTLTPIGSWVQISDKTNKPHSIIRVYSSRGKLFGKILKAFSENGIPPDKYCTKCRGKLHNAKIIGLVIMRNFKQTDDNVWSDGTILDPKIGKIYKCRLTLSDDGKTLYVRGYIGFPLLGRTQTWYRK